MALCPIACCPNPRISPEQRQVAVVAQQPGITTVGATAASPPVAPPQSSQPTATVVAASSSAPGVATQEVHAAGGAHGVIPPREEAAIRMWVPDIPIPTPTELTKFLRDMRGQSSKAVRVAKSHKQRIDQIGSAHLSAAWEAQKDALDAVDSAMRCHESKMAMLSLDRFDSGRELQGRWEGCQLSVYSSSSIYERVAQLEKTGDKDCVAVTTTTSTRQHGVVLGLRMTNFPKGETSSQLSVGSFVGKEMPSQRMSEVFKSGLQVSYPKDGVVKTTLGRFDDKDNSPFFAEGLIIYTATTGAEASILVVAGNEDRFSTCKACAIIVNDRLVMTLEGEVKFNKKTLMHDLVKGTQKIYRPTGEIEFEGIVGSDEVGGGSKQPKYLPTVNMNLLESKSSPLSSGLLIANEAWTSQAT